MPRRPRSNLVANTYRKYLNGEAVLQDLFAVAVDAVNEGDDPVMVLALVEDGASLREVEAHLFEMASSDATDLEHVPSYPNAPSYAPALKSLRAYFNIPSPPR